VLAPARVHKIKYITAPLEDVLFEQLAFLLVHVTRCHENPKVCWECRLLGRVKALLTARFA
jgi:hypothetical protein